MEPPIRSSEAVTRRVLVLPAFFGLSIFLSASLLFSVQPMVGKMLLPLLGGAPSVWNTVMVFFQAILLAGYAFAHYSFQKLGPARQPFVQLIVLLAAGLFLPFSVPQAPEPDASPALWVLRTLLQNLGLPVFILASTAPLLQKWFAQTSHRSAKDPYFLYAASNAGSFGALLAYPLLMERILPLKEQAEWWARFYWIYAGLITACAFLALPRRGAARKWEAAKSVPVALTVTFKWVGLSLVPSSLMLGVTNYITTDVVSVPLLWVLPLGLYLLTFVIAFNRRSPRLDKISSRAVPILALGVVFPMLVQATEPVWLLLLLQLLFFFNAALQCHLKLAHSRPASENLTLFYLCLSVGGVLGGIFTALLAPMLFNSIIEYPLMILASILIGYPHVATRIPPVALPPIYGGAIVALAMLVGAALIGFVGQYDTTVQNTLAGIFLLTAYLLLRGPVRFTLAVATLLVCTGIFRGATHRVVERQRNFFGVIRVTEDPARNLRYLYHGTTIHGMQRITGDRLCEPLSYYHSAGPVGEITRLFHSIDVPKQVALIGLGAGGMLTFSKPDQHWTLYEIDPAVLSVAQNTNYFTYLSHCSAASHQLVLGDARLQMQKANFHQFGLIYLDAFSSDVIPMHLLTVEAFRLYRQKLAPGGLLGVHISSRHFDLRPLLARLAGEIGLLCYESTEGDLKPPALQEGGLPSEWVLLAPPSLRNQLMLMGTWVPVRALPGDPLWTDDFSSLLPVLK